MNERKLNNVGGTWLVLMLVERRMWAIRWLKQTVLCTGYSPWHRWASFLASKYVLEHLVADGLASLPGRFYRMHVSVHVPAVAQSPCVLPLPTAVCRLLIGGRCGCQCCKCLLWASSYRCFVPSRWSLIWKLR
jgi:hypothetical protein